MSASTQYVQDTLATQTTQANAAPNAPASLRDLFGFQAQERPISGLQIERALRILDGLGYDVTADAQRWTLHKRDSLQTVWLYSPAQLVHFVQTRALGYAAR